MTSDPVPLTLDIEGQRHQVDGVAHLSIGSAFSAALRIEDASIAPNHASLSYDGTTWWFEPVDSAAQCSIDGDAIDRRPISGPMTVTLGAVARGIHLRITPEARAVLPSTRDWWDDAPIARFTVRSGPGVHRTVGAPLRPLILERVSLSTNGTTRLDQLSMSVLPGELVAVLGGSGAGKSSLIKTVVGIERATAGRVLLGDIDIYADFAAVRQSIGYVPQDDVVHASLTVDASLRYAAALRFGPSAEPSMIDQRIADVLSVLGLLGMRQHRVGALSGGQRKRVSVAMELLTRPPLLVLDEPTSGLDAGNEAVMMRLLRQLADDGCAVIVITHATASLDLCDRVLFLARGGVPVYLGPPASLTSTLGVSSITDAFSHVEASDPRSLRMQVDRQRPSSPATVRPAPPQRRSSATGTSAPLVRLLERITRTDLETFRHQTTLLTTRYVDVLLGDRRGLVLLAAQAPVIAALMLVVFGAGRFTTDHLPKAGNVLMAMTLAMIYLGASNSVREIVKERSILRREQGAGLSMAAYLTSKISVLSVVTMAQALLLVVAGTVRQGAATGAAIAPIARLEVIAALTLSGLVAMLLGLLISAVVSTADKAMTVLPVVLFAQLLLAGVIFPVQAFGLQQISWFTASRWGFAATANTIDYGSQCAQTSEETPCSILWERSGSWWLVSMVMLSVLGVGALTAAWWSLDRSDPATALRRTTNP
jgi:ABC transport system ATP-binding/permease protein